MHLYEDDACTAAFVQLALSQYDLCRLRLGPRLDDNLNKTLPCCLKVDLWDSDIFFKSDDSFSSATWYLVWQYAVLWCSVEQDGSGEYCYTVPHEHQFITIYSNAFVFSVKGQLVPWKKKEKMSNPLRGEVIRLYKNVRRSLHLHFLYSFSSWIWKVCVTFM